MDKTFDPTRDPFDPRQERWKGWEEAITEIVDHIDRVHFKVEATP